jgi:hypothetical protein
MTSIIYYKLRFRLETLSMTVMNKYVVNGVLLFRKTISCRAIEIKAE